MWRCRPDTPRCTARWPGSSSGCWPSIWPSMSSCSARCSTCSSVAGGRGTLDGCSPAASERSVAVTSTRIGEVDAQQLGGADDSVRWRCGDPAVGCDVGDGAEVVRAWSPGEIRRADELRVEGLACHCLDGLAAVRVQRYPLEGVLPVRGDVCGAGLLVDVEVIPQAAGGDEFRSGRGIERGWVDPHAHEQLLER